MSITLIQTADAAPDPAPETEARSQPAAGGLVEPESIEAPLAAAPEDLTLQHGLPRLPALAVHVAELPGRWQTRVELRLLGAGHQVFVRVGEQEWSETVAVLADRVPHLPTSTALPAPLLGGGGYEIRCTPTSHSARGMSRQRTRTLEQTRQADATLALRGSDDAAAGLSLHLPRGDDELAWRTWRTSPRDRRLVQTVSSLRLPGLADQGLRAS